MVADGEKAELVLYHVAAMRSERLGTGSLLGRERAGDVLQSVFTSFYASLRLRVAVQPPDDHFRVGLRICKLSLCLFIVDGGCEQEAINPGYLR